MRKLCAAFVCAAVIALPTTAFGEGPGAILQSKNPNVNYTEGTDFTIPSNPVPVGNALAPVSTADDGCEATDFAGFPTGDIALVERGTCTFRQKVENAQAAGASGVLIYNHSPGLTGVSLIDADVSIPVLFITQALGQSFVSRVEDGGMSAHMLVRKPKD